MTEAASESERAAIRATDTTAPITCVVFRDGKPAPAPAELGDISEILKEQGRLVWFDVVDPGPQDLALLQEEFELHPLAVEDAVAAHQRPKVESYESYWFFVVHATTIAGGEIRFHEIDIFVGSNFVVTVRHDPTYPIEEIEKRWRLHPEELRKGTGFLLYTILDTIVDGYIPVAETFQERVDALEEDLFVSNPQAGDVLQEIFSMKKGAQRFRRVALPMREILTPLTRQDVILFSRDESLYFRDVYDHAILVIDQLDAMRDLMNSALEIHLSVIGNRQNEVAKQLTIIATIFLPLSFIVGFFGQNFAFMVNHIGGTMTFWLLGVGSEVATVFLTLLFFRVRGWF